MAVYGNANGAITLSFYRLEENSTLTELRSKHIEYNTVADAWNAAVEALDRFPRITYAEIHFTPVAGHLRSIEKITRGPLF